MVLLRDVSQIEELAKGSRHWQQFIVRQVLQCVQQRLAAGFIASS